MDTAGGRIWDEARIEWVAVDLVRAGPHGQYVLRLTRKLANHPAFDAGVDTRYERILTGFTAWLELGDGSLQHVVRVSAPRGSELRDVGKWAVEYAPVS